MPHVLIAAFDGLQPAQVRPDLMPNLARFASEGVFFENHHPVFPSVTRINAASMVTGVYSGKHGLAANTMVARDYDPTIVFSALEPTLADVARKTGRALFAPTLADILAGHGMEYTAIGVGTSGNAYVHNPRADESGGATIHPDFTLPYSLFDRLESRFGAWPGEAMPNTPRLDHAVRILTEHVLPERQPAAALIWSSEPDKAQHATGVGSEMSDRAVREADARFGAILEWLEANGRADTDVLVISDHGYSTIQETVDIEWYTRDAGFSPQDVIVAPNRRERPVLLPKAKTLRRGSRRGSLSAPGAARCSRPRRPATWRARCPCLSPAGMARERPSLPCRSDGTRARTTPGTRATPIRPADAPDRASTAP